VTTISNVTDRHVVHSLPQVPYGLAIDHPAYHQMKADLKNPCQQADCSHMCLLTQPRGDDYPTASCVCPDHYFMQGDRCVPFNETERRKRHLDKVECERFSVKLAVFRLPRYACLCCSSTARMRWRASMAARASPPEQSAARCRLLAASRFFAVCGMKDWRRVSDAPTVSSVTTAKLRSAPTGSLGAVAAASLRSSSSSRCSC
jgi:hypothetical protein